VPHGATGRRCTRGTAFESLDTPQARHCRLFVAVPGACVCVLPWRHILRRARAALAQASLPQAVIPHLQYAQRCVVQATQPGRSSTQCAAEPRCLLHCLYPISHIPCTPRRRAQHAADVSSPIDDQPPASVAQCQDHSPHVSQPAGPSDTAFAQPTPVFSSAELGTSLQPLALGLPLVNAFFLVPT